MHPEISAVFAFFARKFPGLEVAIHGSALRDFDSARDIDVMVRADAPYPWLVGQLGLRYSGWDAPPPDANGCISYVRGSDRGVATGGVHLRRTVRPLHLEGVSKPVQLSQSSRVQAWSDHPHCLLLPSGETLNPGLFYAKPRRP